MRKCISEVIGHATSIGKSSLVVYRAVRVLWCAACGGEIAEGSLFTRRTLAGQGLRISPRCQKCAPFHLRDASEKTRSAVVESVLSPAANRPAEQTRRDPEKIAEAVERRLGPALRRARRVR